MGRNNLMTRPAISRIMHTTTANCSIVSFWAKDMEIVFVTCANHCEKQTQLEHRQLSWRMTHYPDAGVDYRAPLCLVLLVQAQR